MTDDLLKTLDTPTEPAMDREALGRADYEAHYSYLGMVGRPRPIVWEELTEATREEHRFAGCAAATEFYRSLLARGWIKTP